MMPCNSLSCPSVINLKGLYWRATVKPFHLRPVFIQSNTVFVCRAQFGHIAQRVVDVVHNRRGDNLLHAVGGKLTLFRDVGYGALVRDHGSSGEKRGENLLREINTRTAFVPLAGISGRDRNYTPT